MAYSTATIAQGAYGKVYKQKYNDTWAAIKKVPVHLISKKDLDRECEVYKKAEHPNIVKLLGKITLREGKWIIPLEFIFGEDLETTIFNAAKSKIQLSPSVKGTIIIGMCEGLFHMHSKGIVHQDLKPDNIMVEQNTNRAVIIDMGLAKIFRNGLSSAGDGGNPAYSAPEVHRGSSRDQRSDVWAMGKIIAELCARIRLHTPSVCPDKIKAVLKDQPFCHAVCRMVETDPSIRASMGGIISNIRSAGGAGTVKSTPVQKEHLKLPTPINARNRSPSPGNRGVSLVNRVPTPMPRGAASAHKDPQPLSRPAAPLIWERSSQPDVKAVHPKPTMHLSPKPQRTVDKNKSQALVQSVRPKADLNQDLMKKMLYQEAAKGLPCNLPTNGTVVMRRFEEKDGEMQTWEQKEVVMRDGRVAKYGDIKMKGKYEK